jgi:hypothetical protein
VHDHHQSGVVAEALLVDAPHRDPVLAEDLGDLRQHPGLVGDLEVQVEGRLEVLGDLQLRVLLEERRATGDHRDDVAEHRGGGLRAAGAGARHRDLRDRRRLDHDGVERALDRRQRVAREEEAGEDADAELVPEPLGDPEQLQREPELLGIGEVLGGDRLDPLVGNLVEGHRGAERQSREDHHLRRRVGAVHVLGRVGLGVAALLGVGERVSVGGAGLRHLGEDEVGRPVDDPEDLFDRDRSEALLDHPDHRDRAGDRGLEAKLRASLSRRRDELGTVLGDQLLIGGDDVAALPQRAVDVLACGVDTSHQLDDDVAGGEDLLEVALLAAQHARHLRRAPGDLLDHLGALFEQLLEGAAHGPLAEDPDVDRLLRHR